MRKVYRVGELKHYASPYYDPQKAHEYYEEHKKLKGQSSTPTGYTLNDTGHEASTYVSKVISDKKTEAKNTAKTEIENLKTETETNVSDSIKETATEVLALAEKIFSTPKAELKANGNRYKSMINNLRKKNSDHKKQLSKEYSDKVKTIRENLSSQLESLTNANKEEQSKIKNDSSMLKATKSGSSSKSGGVTKNTKISEATLAEVRKRSEKIKAKNESKST